MQSAKHSGRRGGQALLAVSLSLIFLFAAMGLSVDLGWAYFLKTRVQTAADAAASAAAVYAKANGDNCSTISCGTTYTCAGVYPPTTSLQAGCLYTTVDSPPTFTATMVENNTTPPGVTGNSPSMWVQANVSTSAPNLFLFGVGYKIASIQASAIAGVTSIPSTSCIYQIGTGNIAQAVSVTGSSSITASGCGVYVNSSSTTALYVTGSSHVSGNFIKVVGSVSLGGTSTVSPTATTGATAVADPLASLPAPSYSGCDHTNYSIGNANSATVSPGVYCGGITVTGAATLNLNPGNYILNGGGLTVSNSGTLNGTHVMFYNTASGSYTIAPISIQGSAIATLSAPSSGTYQGIVFFQDRSQTYASANVIANSGTGLITGTYYFPTTAFNFTGATSTAFYAAFIAKTIVVSGSSTIQNDTSGTYTGLTTSSATLSK